MTIPKRVACITGGFLLALSQVGVAQTMESECILRLHDQRDYKGEVVVHWSKDSKTTFALSGTDKWLVSPPIKLSTETKSFEIQGSLSWKHYQRGNQKSSGVSNCPFVDFTPVLRTLRSQESWGKRMDQFVKELDRLEKLYPDREDSPSEWLQPNGPVPKEELAAAEKRLKFDLPKEHKQMLQDFGAWSFSDSSCVSANDLATADKQMKSIWGSPSSEFHSLSAKTKELYRSSVMLYVEAGDGYGALLFHPTASGGEYYWIHQDNLDEPNKLVDSMDNPRDFSSAMRWLIATQILMYYEDAIPDYIFIDRSSPIPFPYQLRLDFPAPKQMTARLDVEWSKCE